MPEHCPLCAAHVPHEDDEVLRRYHPPAFPNCPLCCAYQRHTPEDRARYHVPDVAPGELLTTEAPHG